MDTGVVHKRIPLVVHKRIPNSKVSTVNNKPVNDKAVNDKDTSSFSFKKGNDGNVKKEELTEEQRIQWFNLLRKEFKDVNVDNEYIKFQQTFPNKVGYKALSTDFPQWLVNIKKGQVS
ncbi:MAG: hypothetical protein IMZ64_05490 [Bacteroidetes bacterium]|nr:hypothetical protein [Bacteroidota bacterium]